MAERRRYDLQPADIDELEQHADALSELEDLFPSLYHTLLAESAAMDAPTVTARLMLENPARGLVLGGLLQDHRKRLFASVVRAITFDLETLRAGGRL